MEANERGGRLRCAKCSVGIGALVDTSRIEKTFETWWDHGAGVTAVRWSHGADGSCRVELIEPIDQVGELERKEWIVSPASSPHHVLRLRY